MYQQITEKVQGKKWERNNMKITRKVMISKP